ncbi:serine hydrolase [Solirubrobacter sp. CPCC 204708]|uniref:Class A beta-lactamase-related serine hydrolase n=1 Tax=Solirubrobacter deserti TaxID=2282478 RepID=A0ABT4RFZ4_9ACTN|nr:serine hydrolase [Solirubrobacter deserti]MBE2318154.1 serine hydrolase [Solirubrobacter deserti]MDA0137435.1 class A beta-lactamase-related serine hydrolase [Solirubrobacter deserti]
MAYAVAGADGRIRGHDLDVQFRSASMTKAMLLVAVLRAAADRPLAPHEDERLRPMIVRSSNKAAREVYKTYGDASLNAVARAARMTHFQPVGALFEARITAADQARFFLRLDRLLPARHRAYARELLAGVTRGQRWGIAPVAERRGFTVLFKGGWRKGLTHQAALLERDGRRVALAVLTSDEPSVAYGAATLAGVAARVLHA